MVDGENRYFVKFAGAPTDRAGEKITNDYDGITHDYSRKGGVVYTEILLPEDAPDEYTDRSILWNAVEKIEKAKNSQLAREIELALPVELTREQNIYLVREYARDNFVDSGMCADICVHDKNDGNPHAHIMLTLRPFNVDKSWGDKQRKEYILDKNGEKIYDPKKRQYKCKSVPTTDWNEQIKAEEWRAAWADAVNAVLKQPGVEERVDHRSYERQGIEQIPTIHMGVAATQMEQRGIVTDRGNMNREIVHSNGILFAILMKLKQLKDWLKQTLTPAAPITLVEILRGILEGGEYRDRYGKISDVKTVARVLDFMRENDISSLPELREKYSEALTRYDNTRENVRYYEQRISTLDENIRQGGIYLEHRELYNEYLRLKPRKQPKFYETHRTGLTLFEYAKRYFKEHRVGSDFSVTAWKAEQENLTAEKGKIYRECNAVKGQFSYVETIRLDAEKIARELVRNMNPPRKETRSRGMER